MPKTCNHLQLKPLMERPTTPLLHLSASHKHLETSTCGYRLARPLGGVYTSKPPLRIYTPQARYDRACRLAV
jgi:hypothetical protein